MSIVDDHLAEVMRFPRDEWSRIYAKLRRSEHKFDPGRGTFGAWVAMIAWQERADAWRRESRRGRMPRAGRLEPWMDVPRGDVPSTGEAGRLEVAFGELRGNVREVVELVYFRGLTLSAVAAVQGAPLGTIKSRLARGLASMRDRLMLGHG